MSRAWPLALAVGVAVVLAAACDVPTQHEAAPIDAERVPTDLRTAADGPQDTSRADVEVTVFFVSGQRLVAATRRVADRGPESVLRALLAGPAEHEIDHGVRSAFPDADMVLGARTEGDVAFVDLSSEFTDADPAEQRVALAQLVYSLTAIPGIGAVDFTLEGEPTNVPRADGTTTAGPVQRSDYAASSPSAP